MRVFSYARQTFNHQAPIYIQNLFEPTVINNDFPILRFSSSNNFITPKPKKELLKHSRSYSGPNMECITLVNQIIKYDLNASSTGYNF